ncbi:MAG: tRNA lysidine(34) synthetase TilS [Rickettsiales bacterium]|jgi:tRNA(Ile)-lysidine synthase|nr:tRNA lysidine(34) synthetase TilS [Rickettsiales bacterium]
MNKYFYLSMTRFQMDFPDETYAVAVSGGADSMALLHWMKNSGVKIVALTVDHKLRPESKIEARHVASVCEKLGTKHEILEWTGDKPDVGIENAARKARYDLLLSYCKKNNIGVLATAHHADDQIETFLMNLGRGSGVYGLAGIRERTEQGGIIVFRPLLRVPRADLRNYCDENKIRYFDDAMNDDEKYLRVKIRGNRGFLAEKLGISDGRLLLAIENLERARNYIESESKKIIHKIPVEFDAPILLNVPDELRFRALSMMLSADYPIRLDDIKNAFAKLDGGDCKFTLAGFNIRKLNDKIRIWKEGTKWQKSKKRN